MIKGKIVRSISGFYDISSNGKVYRTRARGNFRNKRIKPVVGDNVSFDDNGDQLGYLTEVSERKNFLIRPPMANVDQAIVVTSVVEPDFSAILLDKILLNLEKNLIHPIIYMSKEDIAGDKIKRITDIIKYYERIYPVIHSNDFKVTEFHELFSKKVTVFTGQTGSGKSTLLNKINPELNLKTAEISSTLNRGKHTTRQVSLFDFKNGLVADTPGFSSVDLRDINLEEIQYLYPEFVKYQDGCKYRRCTHINEPGCAVKEQLLEDNISIIRYNDYKTIRKEIENRKIIYNKRER